MNSRPNRVEFLDSIRGLAALFVLFSHTIGAFNWPPSFFEIVDWPFISILINGKEAVAMFFVLSGYVLSKPYVDSGSAPRKLFLSTFLLRRFIRIWPPWFFAFIVSIVAQKFLFFKPITQPSISGWLNTFWQAELTVADFFRQCLFSLHDPTRLLLNQDWSLGVELKGSALIPLFLICLKRKRLEVLLSLAAFFLIFVFTGHYYVSFIIGTLVAYFETQWISWLARQNEFFKGFILLCGLSLYQSYNLACKLFYSAHLAVKCGWVMTAVGCAVILASVLGSQTLQRMLNCHPFVFLGRISYSVYLVQFIMILCVLPPLVAEFNRFGIVQPLILMPVTMLVSFGTTVGFASIMYRLVEVPVIDFGHRLTKRIQRNFHQ